MNAPQPKSSLPLDAKYRPRRPEDFIGQDEAVRVFYEQINNDLAPAFLLHGPPGVGKTSWAEMFAMTRICGPDRDHPCGTCESCRTGRPNKLHFFDFSGAAHNSVEVMQTVEMLMSAAPRGNFGCFVDEVHGLQPKAADVILKEAETPRRGRYFICATTELQSVRPALRSRCIIVPFLPVRPPQLFGLAQRICAEERISFEPEALDILVSQARGSPRELVKGLEAVSRRGHLTRDILKSALSLDWTEELLAYTDALFSGDLPGQLEAMEQWLARPSDKARHIKELLLFIYNFEVSTPRIRNVVNPAFHLISADRRQQMASAVAARGRVEGLSVETYWTNLQQFWLLDPAILQDDASLAIKLHEFHRLINPANRPVVIAEPLPVTGSAKREFRKRSQRASDAQASDDDIGPASQLLDLKNTEKIAEAASFMGQHYGCLVNLSSDLTIVADRDVEAEARQAITRLTHELSQLARAKAGKSANVVHWIYRTIRQGDKVICRLAAHVPYEQLEGSVRWMEAKDWSAGTPAFVTLAARFHDPKCRNPKARDTSRLKFHWERICDLWAGLDPNILHWDAKNARQPLRRLLGLKSRPVEVSDPTDLKLVGISHSLQTKERAAAEANKMDLISAFKDAAWDHIATGWELDEFRDRTAEIAARDEQLRRVELIREGGELAQKRYQEDLDQLRASWPDNPRLRPRTWTPWSLDSGLHD